MKRVAEVRVLSFLVIVALITSVLGGQSMALPAAPAAPAAAGVRVWKVNTIADYPDANPSDGKCAAANGTCTLRAAITQANTMRGPDRIEFAIGGGAGVKVLNITSVLPEIDDSFGGTTIDGYTQPGSKANTAAQGSNAVINIEIRTGNKLATGLLIRSAENTVRGVMINGFERNIYLLGERADGNKIIGNFVGVTSMGGAAAWGSHGIEISLGGDRNAIGTPDLADRNIISGNRGYGVRINHGDTSENRIQNNVMGMTPALDGRLPQISGIDVQWWTWGNLVGGSGPNEGNIISGNQNTKFSHSGGVDLSHSSTANLVIGNYIGTLADGNTTNAATGNTNGILIKDNSNNNYIADNVVTNSTYDGIIHRDNYGGDNTFVRNRIGVGLAGNSAGNRRNGIMMNGHDHLHVDNIIGNSPILVKVVDEYIADSRHVNYPSEKTQRDTFHQTTFVSPGTMPQIDIWPLGETPNDPGDADKGPNWQLNAAWIDFYGPGKVGGHLSCAGCLVEVLISGTSPEGVVTGPNGGYWIGSVKSDAAGKWGLASTAVVSGQTVTTYVVDNDGNTSETRSVKVGSTMAGTVGPVTASLPRIQAPPMPKLPPLYKAEVFECSWNNGVLSWSNAGAPEYYVASRSRGQFRYIGTKKGTSTPAPPADSYEISHWRDGFAVSTFCSGPGAPRDDSVINVSVVDLSGKPVSGVGVDLFSQGRASWLRSSKTSADGTTSFAVAEGCYVVTLIGPNRDEFVSGRYANHPICVTRTAPVGVSDTLLINAAAATTIAGQVTDRSGVAEAGISVELFTSDNGKRGKYLRYTKTDANGNYSFDLPGAGCYLVTFVAPPGERFVENPSRYMHVSLCVAQGAKGAARATVNRGSAPTDGRLSGTISDPRGAVSEVSIDIFAASADGSRGSWIGFAKPTAAGTYEINVNGGCYVLTYVAPKTRRWEANGGRWLNRAVCVNPGKSLGGLNEGLNP